MKKRKILFITGTRADYGKLKPLMRAVENNAQFDCHIFVSGMHLLENFGYTYGEIEKDGYRNVHVAKCAPTSSNMSINFGNSIIELSNYLELIKPDLMIVHGDRTDALAGAVAGALNNIKVAHVEGGEVSGTIDESIRHAISKFAHIHFTCNQEATRRLIQLGEDSRAIFEIGSPDIDVMLSNTLPSLNEAKSRYDIDFSNYCILMYHPVVTEFTDTAFQIDQIVSAIKESGSKCITIFPNNDLGSDDILLKYNTLDNNFRVFPSLRFEYFLTLLRHANYIIGNSSAGIREACVYGIPAIDIGSRQQGRCIVRNLTNVQHVGYSKDEILISILNTPKYRHSASYYGKGDSVAKFMQYLTMPALWNIEQQKRFIDIGDIYD